MGVLPSTVSDSITSISPLESGSCDTTVYAVGLDFLPECEHRFFLALQSGKAISKSLVISDSHTQLLLHVHPDWVKTQNEAARTIHCKFLFEMLLPSVAFMPSSFSPIFSREGLHLSPTSTSRKVSTAIWTEPGSAKVTTPILCWGKLLLYQEL